MNIDINKALEQLAKAFNTTVDALYPMLIKQAYVSGVSSIIAILLSVAVIITILSLFKKNGLKRDSYGLTDGAVVSIIVAVVATIISVVTILGNGHNALTALINPEYWALKEILTSINPRN